MPVTFQRINDKLKGGRGIHPAVQHPQLGREGFESLRQLNGVKKLVMGNHDQYNIQDYLPYFSQIYAMAKMRGCLFTHVPIHPYQFYRFKANIHGHMHSATIDDPRYINVCAEHTNLTPVLLDTVMLRVPNDNS